MLEHHFDKSVRRIVEPVVAPWGFATGDGRGCTFHRKVHDELFHFIHFSQLSSGIEFEVWIFPGTPLLGSEQWARFPDFVGVPTGRAAGLNAKVGVGGGASRFPCRDSKVLDVALSRAAVPALQTHACPYLDHFQSLKDLVPVLEHPQWASLLVRGQDGTCMGNTAPSGRDAAGASATVGQEQTSVAES